MSVDEINKRKHCNRVIKLTGEDPYTDYSLERVMRLLKRRQQCTNRALKILAKLQEITYAAS